MKRPTAVLGLAVMLVGLMSGTSVSYPWAGDTVKAITLIESSQPVDGTNLGLYYPQNTPECAIDSADPACFSLVGGFDHGDWAKYSYDFGTVPPDSVCLWLGVTGDNSGKMFWFIVDDVTDSTTKVIARLRTNWTADWMRVAPQATHCYNNATTIRPTGVHDLFIKAYSPLMGGGAGNLMGFQFFSGGVASTPHIVRTTPASAFTVASQGRTLQVVLPQAADWRLSVLRSNGSVISQQDVRASALALPADNMTSGTYLLRAVSGGRELSQFFTISR